MQLRRRRRSSGRVLGFQGHVNRTRSRRDKRRMGMKNKIKRMMEEDESSLDFNVPSTALGHLGTKKKSIKKKV